MLYVAGEDMLQMCNQMCVCRFAMVRAGDRCVYAQDACCLQSAAEHVFMTSAPHIWGWHDSRACEQKDADKCATQETLRTTLSGPPHNFMDHN